MDTDFIYNFLKYTILNFCNCKKECIIDGVDQNSSIYKTIDKISDEISKNNKCNLLNTTFNYPLINRTTNKYKYLSVPNDIKIKKNVRLWYLDYIINDFIKNGLLNKRDTGLYLLNTFKRFTWANIQSLNINNINFDSDDFYKLYFNVMRYSDNTREIMENKFLEKKHNPIEKYNIEDLDKIQFLKLIKIIFWYFRKCCVDSIITELISNMNNIIGLSVGSTNLTSDYDITLYGRNKDLSLIIKTFKKIIGLNFYDTSNIIFDTNIYGVSFIIIGDYSFISDTPIQSEITQTDMIIPYSPKTSILHFFKKDIGPIKIKGSKILNKYEDYISENIICKSKVSDTFKNFRYFINNSNTDIFITQHVWAFVKLLLRINIIKYFDEIMYSKLIDKLFKKIDYDYLYNADKIINIFNIKTPPNIIFSFTDFEELLKNNDILDEQFIIHNYISFVQYHNNETYFSKGAFMDVVVNSQMCNINVINLSIHEYFDSFIENMAEFITHYQKYKYLNRSIKSFDNLYNLSSYPNKVNVKSKIDRLFIQLEEKRKNCYNMITKQCIPFNMIEDILKCIVLSFKIYQLPIIKNSMSFRFLNNFDKLIKLSQSQ